VGFAVTPKVTAEAHGEYWQLAFDGDEVFDDFGLAAQLNRESLTAGGGIGYRVTPLTTIRLLGDVSRIRFDEASFRDTDTQQMLFGVELNPRALISGSARVGYQRFRPLNSAVPEFNGVVGTASVSYRLRPSTSVGFTFDRRTDFSYIIVEPYYVREGYGLSIRRELPAQLDVTLSASRTSHRYLRLLRPEDDNSEGHRERFFDLALTFGYDVGPRTRMTVDLGYRKRNSDFDVRGYDGVGFGVSIIYGF
jgi:opacity protein-like surface antigen